MSLAIAENARRATLVGLASIGLVAGLEGCAHVRPTKSGYLTDNSALIPAKTRLHAKGGLQRALLRPATPEALTGIDSFYVEPIAWLVDPETRAANDEDLRERVVAGFDRDLREKLAAIRPIVDTPGPRTALVRGAVTEVVRARPITNVVLTVVAVPLANGGGTFEVEVLAPDKRQIAAVSSSSSGGVLELLGYFSRSRQAVEASRRAASEITGALTPETR